MSNQPINQTAAMLEKKTSKQSVRETTVTSTQQAQRDPSKDASKRAYQQARGPAFPLVNPHKNLQAQYGRMHDEMIDLWRDGQPEEAERLAHTLLSFGNLLVLYRAYAHIVLAHGLEDCLFHAQKAVEEAEWGLNKYGDNKGAGSKLLAITQRVLAKREAEARLEEEDGDDDDDDGEEEPEVEEESKTEEDFGLVRTKN